MSQILDVRGCEQFVAAHPEYFACEHNHKAIRKWLASHGVPWSLRNIEVAFSELSKDGALKQRPEITDYTVTQVPLTAEDKGVQKMRSGLVLRYDTGGIAENQLAAERPERMTELLGDTIAERAAEDAENRKLAGSAGKPVHSKLRVKYQQSLGTSQRRNADNPYSKQYAEARAVIGLTFPDLKIGSAEYNRKVAEVLDKSK
jgi:hypothetical protein